MNTPPPNSDFNSNEIDRIVGQFGKPLESEHRKGLTERLRDERKRYEETQKSRKPKSRDRGSNGR